MVMPIAPSPCHGLADGQARRPPARHAAPPACPDREEPPEASAPGVRAFGCDRDATARPHAATGLRLGACGGRPAPAGRVAPAGPARRGDLGAAIREAIAAIAADPAIAGAFAAWDRLGVDAKLAVARRIGAHLGAAFAFAPNLAVRFDPTLDAEGALGLWTPDGIRLSAAALADPARFLDTVVHEQIHEYDHQDEGVVLAAPDHNAGPGDDAVYRIGHAIAGAVLGAA